VHGSGESILDETELESSLIRPLAAHMGRGLLANPGRTSALNTIVVASWSKERREDGNGETCCFLSRSGFARAILAGLFDSSPAISVLILFIDTSLKQ